MQNSRLPSQCLKGLKSPLSIPTWAAFFACLLPAHGKKILLGLELEKTPEFKTL